MASVKQQSTSADRRRFLAGVVLLTIALSPGALAVADSSAKHAGLEPWVQRAVLNKPRDPLEFYANLRVVLPPPVIVQSRRDAVAAELVRNVKSLAVTDVMRTADTICDEADAHGFDPLLFVAVMHIESYYDHLALSPVGAEGLMQLMPATAAWMSERLEREWPDGHSFNPITNVILGVRYFDFLYRRFGRLDTSLTAYNRGPAATRYILQRHGRLPEEIRTFYAGKVLDRYAQLLRRYGERANSWSRISG